MRDVLDKVTEGLRASGWVHLEGVLTPEELVTIGRFFKEHREEFRPALVGKGERRQRREEVRGDYTYWLDPLSPPDAFSRPIAFLEELRQQVNRRLFLGLKEFECHLASYPPGSFYKKHSDRFEEDSSRSLSFIFYLHESWQEGDGGELELFTEDGQSAQVLKPMPGSFACFLSSDFPHEVRKSGFERRSLTGWMHTKIIS